MTIKIDKGVPLPPSRGGSIPGQRRSVFWEMDIGDSVFLMGETNLGGRVHHQRQAGWKFAERRVVENGIKGIRVWRIA